MGRRQAAFVSALAALLAACGQQGAELPRAERIILVSLDTLRADMLGAYGYDEYPTSPALDAFARESVLFENHFTTEPWTLTAHMSLFTGLYPQNHRVREDAPLAATVPTLADRLWARGYRTQAFVDGGYVDAFWGFDRGFEAYVNVYAKGLKALMPRAKQWLREHGDEPFFLFLHTYDVHSRGPPPRYRTNPPFDGMFSAQLDSDLKGLDGREFEGRVQARAGRFSEADKRYVRATYAEGIRYVDYEMGELFAFLREEGLYDDALIVIWSDHGEGLYDHEVAHHGEVYSHTIRVPLIIKLPGGVAAGRRIATPVSAVDLAPTILSLAGAPAEGMDGESLMPFVQAADRNRVVYSYRTERDERLYAASDRDYLYFRDEQNDRTKLFDKREDPLELVDLAELRRAEAERLGDAVDDWLDEHGRGLWGPDADDPREPDAELRARLKALGYVD